jgi:hypothetical protein
MCRTQTEVSLCTTMTIMCHPHFALGLADIRAGRPFDAQIDDHLWAYDRGRLFGAIAPLSMPLFKGKALNPKAVALFDAACDRKLIG